MRIRHLRWYIAALLFAASMINYIDRQALSVVAPILTRELHLSPMQYAGILQWFLYAYTITYVINGWVVDRWGTRRSMAVFMAWWSASNMAHALASGAGSLSAFRCLLGMGESGSFMASIKVASEWFPAKDRAVVNGLVNAGAAAGAVVAPPLVVWLATQYGWRFAFVATGATGFVWLIAWLALYELPERHKRITAEELALIQAPAPAAPVQAKGYLQLLALRQTWALLGARFLSDPVWWFYLFWLPKYLVEHRGFTLLQMGVLAWLPYLCADLGSVAGGLVSGALIQRGWAAGRARRAVMLPCALSMPLSIAVALTPSSGVAIALICVVLFAHMAWRTNLTTMTNDLYPRALVGSVSGLIAFGTGLGGALFTNLTGHLVERYSYTSVFYIMGFLHPAALLLLGVLLKKRRE
ncbi:MFS transporter [Paludibaculum fermentans]|uniref:MFS transporter n=1 Tax=Paludibaculum fermentans TaxID=1473598 RepID=A0A7S7SJ04_PALFE|nr:MFS transporter [Paludibaculum fermentans]QOY85480.1 MFS transporter [Paludibaculum fermentans]